MSLPFFIAHTTEGRTRIRWSGDAAEKSGIIEIAEHIAGVPGVDQALPRTATGSIIIEHDQVQWPVLEPRILEQTALIFCSPPRPPHGLQTLNIGLDKIDETLKGLNTDLSSVTVLLLTILAITQAARGQVMGNSMSFLWYALSIAAMSRNAPAKVADSNAQVGE